MAYLKAHERESLRDAALIVIGVVFIALGAQVRIHLPFSPVPVTMQTFAVLLAGALLGRQRGTAATLAYLTSGLLGLPVFNGWSGGASHLLGPTGGYLVGFVAAAYVTGALIERGWHTHAFTTFLALLVGDSVIYLCGLPWLAAFVGTEKAIALGLWPFLLGDLVKTIATTTLLYNGASIRGQSLS